MGSCKKAVSWGFRHAVLRLVSSGSSVLQIHSSCMEERSEAEDENAWMYASYMRGGDRESGLHLLAAVNQTLLRRRDAFLLFDALLYALDL
jgi:hypothetical protein